MLQCAKGYGILTTNLLSQGGKGGGGAGIRRDYSLVPKENPHLERLYNDLAIIPENEKEEFWAAMRRDLPSSFRFTGSKGYVTVQVHCSFRFGGLVLIRLDFEDMRLQYNRN